MAIVTVEHAKKTGAAADPSALVDGVTWDTDPHIVTGLDQINNTSDINKPVSTAQAAADAAVAATAAAATALKANIGKPLVIFCAGQSNFVLNPSFTWTPESNALVWNNTIGTVGTGTAFVALDGTHANLASTLASGIARKNPSRTVYVIDSAFSGEAISHWLTGTGAPDGYADAVANVTAALAVIGVTKIDLFAWWQGEADTGPLNASYAANHATMMTRFWSNSWFPQETPVLIYGIESTAINPANTDADHMNDMLLSVVNADPDKRRFVYAASMSSATYWDASNVGHMTGQGYFSAGMLGAAAYSNGPGRNSLKNVVVDPASGNVMVGASVAGSAPLTVSQNATPVLASVSTGVPAYFAGADASGAFLLTDAFGGFSGYIGRSAAGTYAAKTTLTANWLITSFGAQGYDGTAYSSANVASLNFVASESWTTTHHGTYASLYNTLPGTLTNAESLRVSPGNIQIFGVTSGGITFAVPPVAGSNTITWPAGTTDFSATGGASRVLKQTSAGGAFTVAQIDTSDLTDGSWTAYTPAVTASTGTFTTVSATGRYKRFGSAGKTILLQIDVTITTAGTATGILQATLPFTAAAFNFTGTAREHALTGKAGASFVAASASTVTAVDTTAVTFIASGGAVAFGITYEVP